MAKSNYDADLDHCFGEQVFPLNETTQLTVGFYSYNGGAAKCRFRMEQTPEAAKAAIDSGRRVWSKNYNFLATAGEDVGAFIYHMSQQVMEAMAEEPEPEPEPVKPRVIKRPKAQTKAGKAAAGKRKPAPLGKKSA